MITKVQGSNNSRNTCRPLCPSAPLPPSTTTILACRRTRQENGCRPLRTTTLLRMARRRRRTDEGTKTRTVFAAIVELTIRRNGGRGLMDPKLFAMRAGW